MGTGASWSCWLGREFLLTKFLKRTPPELLLPSLILIPFVLLQFYLLGVAQAQERFREYNIRQIVPNLLGLIGLVITLILLHMGLVGAVLVQVVIQVFMTIWMVVPGASRGAAPHALGPCAGARHARLRRQVVRADPGGDAPPAHRSVHLRLLPGARRRRALRHRRQLRDPAAQDSRGHGHGDVPAPRRLRRALRARRHDAGVPLHALHPPGRRHRVLRSPARPDSRWSTARRSAARSPRSSSCCRASC